MQLTLDHAMQAAGPFGPYQWCIFSMYSAVTAWSAGTALITPFLTIPPEWRRAGGHESFPSHPLAACEHHYGSHGDWEWVNPENALNSDLLGPSALDSPCDAGRLEVASASSMYFIGTLVGMPTIAPMADRLGRRKIFLLSLVVMLTSQVLSASARTFHSYGFYRFVVGFGGAGLSLVSYVYCSEFVGKRYLPQFNLCSGMSWTLGICYMSLIAYLFRGDWRLLTRVQAAPGVLLLLSAASFPESPAFLLAQGRAAEAQEVMLSIARRNGKTKLILNDLDGNPLGERVVVDRFDAQKQEGSEDVDTWKDVLIVRPKRLSIMGSVWFVVAMGYYAISLGVGDLGSNIYITSALMGLIEVPSGIVLERTNHVWGRRSSLLGSLSISASASILAGLASGALQIAIALIGKFWWTFTFGLIYLYSAELFPASVRAFAMTSQSTMGRIGSIAAPIALELNNPMLAVGFLSCFAVPLTAILPETLGKPMETKLADGEGRDVLTFADLRGGDASSGLDYVLESATLYCGPFFGGRLYNECTPLQDERTSRGHLLAAFAWLPRVSRHGSLSASLL